MSADHSIFCCKSTVPVKTSDDNKLHNNPNKELHDTLFHSFINFAIRRHDSNQLLMGLDGHSKEDPPSTKKRPPIQKPQVIPTFTFEALKNNPLTSNVPYVMHLTSREDYGPVYSHRYFMCPPDLQGDWLEITLIQWYGAGWAFRSSFDNWDLKCREDGRFFRLELRPNLDMRQRQEVLVLPPVLQECNVEYQIQNQVVGNSEVLPQQDYHLSYQPPVFQAPLSIAQPVYYSAY